MAAVLEGGEQPAQQPRRDGSEAKACGALFSWVGSYAASVHKVLIELEQQTPRYKEQPGRHSRRVQVNRNAPSPSPAASSARRRASHSCVRFCRHSLDPTCHCCGSSGPAFSTKPCTPAPASTAAAASASAACHSWRRIRAIRKRHTIPANTLLRLVLLARRQGSADRPSGRLCCLPMAFRPDLN